jgi:hypothetical protein
MLSCLTVNQYLKTIAQFSCEANARRETCEPSLSLYPDATNKMRLNFMCRAKDIQDVLFFSHRYRTRWCYVTKENPAGRNASRYVVTHFRGSAANGGKSRQYLVAQIRFSQNYMAGVQPKPRCRDEAGQSEFRAWRENIKLTSAQHPAPSASVAAPVPHNTLLKRVPSVHQRYRLVAIVAKFGQK